MSVHGVLVYGWSRKAGLTEHDSADILQEVFRVVFEKIDLFRRVGPGDSFRGWLWGITKRKIQDFYRRQLARPAGAGGTTAHARLIEIPEPQLDEIAEVNSPQTRRLLLHQALELVRIEFEPTTWQAFWRVAVDGQSAADVAADLALSIGAVYTAKSRVLRRVREEFSELL